MGDALLQFLGGAERPPFGLLDLRRQGLLTDIQIAVRKADVDDVLLFDELSSDGEQVYLGRMALLHLLEDESDALLLLDEPEVHVNDKWKREIVDIIDRVLKDRANDVLISTHSSITLTDVFNDEIVFFDKRDGHSVPIEIRSTTLTIVVNKNTVVYGGQDNYRRCDEKNRRKIKFICLRCGYSSLRTVARTKPSPLRYCNITN